MPPTYLQSTNSKQIAEFIVPLAASSEEKPAQTGHRSKHSLEENTGSPSEHTNPQHAGRN
jgi:hypothetical protein